MSRYANPQRSGRYNNQLARSDNSDESGYTSRYSQGSNYYDDDQYYYESNNQSYISRGTRDRSSFNSNRDSFNSGVMSNQSYHSRGGNGDSFNSGVVSNQQDLRSYASGYSDTQSVQSYGAASNYSRQGNQRSSSGNASVCGSTSATTVAGGGRGRCPYQIGFNVQNAGKQMSTSKRIIHFRFGFANPQALASGLAGVDCRGQEHDLSITWSITGGKRLITLDGREIQYSAGKRSNTARRADIVEAAWRMADHVFELKCYAYKPKEKRNPKWKQYNLTIDGRSFFELPEIFDLGLRGLGTGRLPATISSGSDWDERTDTSSKQTSSLSTMTQHTDQSSVKSSVQSRIEEQRRLLNKKKPGTTTVKKKQPQNPNASVASYAASDLTSSNLMSFRTMSVNDDVEDWGIHSSGVYSAEPSELREVRNRQNSARNSAREQTNGEMTVSNRTGRRQQSAPTSVLVPQQQTQQAHQAQQKKYQPAQQVQNRYQPKQQPQKRYQPKTLPAMSEPSPTVVTNRAENEKQYPPQSDTPVQEMSTHITLAPQQPPTYEEITQALVPSPYAPQQNEVQGHHQLQALPPSSSQQLQILPEQPARNSHYQPQLPSSDQRSAQSTDTSSHYQPHPTIDNQRSPQPASSSSQYQPQPAISAQPTSSSSHHEPQSTESAGVPCHYQYKPVHKKERSPQRPGASSEYQPQPTNHHESRPTEPAGVPSHYQYNPVHNKRDPEPEPTNDFQPQPESSNQRSAEPQAQAVSTQPTHNNQRNAREQPVNKHQEDLPQQLPGSIPKGANKFAFF